MFDCLFTFGDTVSNWHCVVSNVWMAVNSEFERIWKEVAMTKFNLLSQHWPGGTA